MRARGIVALVVAGVLVTCAAVRGPDEPANAPVRWLLKSPLHGALSDQVSILSMRERATGEERAIPVNYARSGERLLLGCDYAWWENLESEPRVELLVAGERVAGVAEIVRDPVRREAGFRELRPGGWQSALAKGAVLIEVTPAPAGAPPRLR